MKGRRSLGYLVVCLGDEVGFSQMALARQEWLPGY